MQAQNKVSESGNEKELVIRPSGPEDRFLKQWKWDPKRRRLENAKRGVAIQVFDAVDPTTNEVIYEGIAFESRRLELHVVVREDDLHVGFTFHRRLSVIPPEISLREFAKNPDRILDVFTHGFGIEEYEASHGLARNELEEVLEEIGLCVRDAVRIGFVKESPSWGGVAHELFAVKVGREPSGASLERGEEIRHVKFFPPEEVKNIHTICGLTQAALWRFRAWGLRERKGSFWFVVASRL